MAPENGNVDVRSLIRRFQCWNDDHSNQDSSQTQRNQVGPRLSVHKSPTHHDDQNGDDRSITSNDTIPPQDVLNIPVESDLRQSAQSSAKRMSFQIPKSLKPHKQSPLVLPDEILLNVFSFVRFSASTSDLVACMRVNRQWYRVGMPSLYRNFVIDVNYRVAYLNGDSVSRTIVYNTASGSMANEHPILAQDRYDLVPSARFYDTTTKLWSQPWLDEGLGTWIYSLSLEIHFWSTETKHPQRHSAAALVKALPNLKTFSVRCAPLRLNDFVERGKFLDLVQCMPRQIQNFELDLQMREIVTTVGSSPLCKALGKLVPQLRSLRLRLGTMCMDFLEEMDKAGQLCPDLRSLSISLVAKDFATIVRCCESAVTSSNTGLILPPFGQSLDWSKPSSVKLIDALEARISTGVLFPNLRACSLVCLRYDMAAADTETRRVICKTLHPKMRTWSKRAYFPCEAGGQPWYVRTDANGDESEMVIAGLRDEDWGTYNISEDLRIKHDKASDQLFEGDACWIEDAFGARHPPTI